MATIDLNQAGDYFAKLDGRMRGAAVKGLQSTALMGLNLILTQIIPSRSPEPVDRGLYRAGWRVLLFPDGADIENNEPHAAFVEEGVRGSNVKIGRAMINALTEWVTRKGLASGVEAVSAAWAIARSMQKRGIFNHFSGSSTLGGMRVLAELNVRLPLMAEQEVKKEIDALF